MAGDQHLVEGFKRLAGASNEPLLLLQDDVIVAANDRALVTFGYTEEEMAGSSLAKLLERADFGENDVPPKTLHRGDA